MDSRPEKTDDPLDEPEPADEGGREPGPVAASRERLCQFLRTERDRAALTIGDIARVTRIPEHSLRRLEAGQFEDLPADVFVRGFLRSYARCVGVDADDVVRRY